MGIFVTDGLFIQAYSMNKKKTLLFYINSIHDGGAERVIIQLAHYFAERGFRSILLTSFVDVDEYPVPNDVDRCSIEVNEIKQSRFKRNWRRIKALRDLCKKERPYAVISFMAEPNFRALCATLLLPVKCFVSVRNDPRREYYGLLGYLISKWLFRLADGVVFQTPDAQRWFPRSIQRKSVVISNPIQESFYHVSRSKNPRHIVTCGRLNQQKNHALLIRAFACIAAKYPQENLLIYGKGSLEEELKQLIISLHLEDRVHLMGLNTQVEKVLAQAKVFVLSSDYEGMPNALMEAVAVGVPSIATDCPCGGPRLLIKNGQNGVLFPCQDEKALAVALSDILSNPLKAVQMGESARQSAQIFKSEVIFEQWEKFIIGGKMV